MAVQPSDIARSLGRPTPDDSSLDYAQWVTWIGDANLLINAEADRRSVSIDSLNDELVDYVVREAVVAQVRRPDDATQVSVSVDDGSTSRTYRSSLGRVDVPDTLMELLFPLRAGGFSISPSFEPDSHRPWWWINGPRDSTLDLQT